MCVCVEGGGLEVQHLIPHSLYIMVRGVLFGVCYVATLCAVCSVQAKGSHWVHSISCVYCKLIVAES